MMIYTISWLPLIVVAVINIIIGSLWYSPKLFGNYWMRVTGISMPVGEELEKAKKGMMPKYLAQFIVTLLGAYMFHVVMFSTLSLTLGAAIKLALVLWLGIVVPANAGYVLWEGKPKGLFALNTGNQLVNMLVAAIVFSIWM